MRAAVDLLLCVLVALGTAACARHGPAAQGPALIVAYPAGLTLVGVDGHAGAVLVPATKTSIPGSPQVSPDGQHIAYLSIPRTESVGSDNGADLWIADRTGGHAHLLLAHPRRNNSVRSPAWLDDTHVLAVIDRPARCAGCNPATTTEQAVNTIDTTTGRARVVRPGVTSFDFEARGATIIYPDTTSGTGSALEESQLNENPARTIVPLSRGFAEITAPRYAPDGATIAFAAAENRSVMTNTKLVDWTSAPTPDGLPEDLWIVPAAGGEARVLSPLHEKTPDLAWDRQGNYLYVVGAVALYRIDAHSGDVQHIGPGVSGGTVAFLPGR